MLRAATRDVRERQLLEEQRSAQTLSALLTLLPDAQLLDLATDLAAHLTGDGARAATASRCVWNTEVAARIRRLAHAEPTSTSVGLLAGLIGEIGIGRAVEDPLLSEQFRLRVRLDTLRPHDVRGPAWEALLAAEVLDLHDRAGAGPVATFLARIDDWAGTLRSLSHAAEAAEA